MVDAAGTRCKAFDTEFGAYGPVGFDLGMLLANLLFAHARASVLGRSEQERWLAGAPATAIAAFRDELIALWPTRCDTRVSDAVLDSWLERAESQAVAFAGCEAIRRVVGFAKVSDLETLEGVQHVDAATAVLTVARRLLTDPPEKVGADLFA